MDPSGARIPPILRPSARRAAGHCPPQGPDVYIRSEARRPSHSSGPLSRGLRLVAMPWYFAVIESEHELQNPTSPGKIRLLGERLRLTPESKVIDIASGRGGPAVLLAEAFGCHITCVEKAEEFDSVARRRVQELRLESLVESFRQDAREFPLGENRFDAAMCLGATFVWDGLSGTLDALKPTVRSGGFVAVGEPYWRVWPLPETYDVDADWREEYVTLPTTVERFRTARFRVQV